MVHFQIDYSVSGDEKVTINFKQSVEKLKEDFYFQSNPSGLDRALFDFTKKDSTDFLSIVGDVEKCNVERTLTFAVTFNLFPKKKELPAGEGLAKKLGTLLMNGEWSDIKLICEGRVFNCHKIVLCCNSEVFKCMLLNKSMEEANSGEIEISDTPAAALESLVHFLYNNSLDRNLINCDLLSAAEKYLVPDLVKICTEYLTDNLTEDNVVDIMVASYEINQKALFHAASTFLSKLRVAGKTFETTAR